MDTKKILANLRPEPFIAWLDTLNDTDHDMFICNLYYNPFSFYLHTFTPKDVFILCFYNGIGFYKDSIDASDLSVNLVEFVPYDTSTDWISDILEDLDEDVSKNVQDPDGSRVISTTIKTVRDMANSKIRRANTQYFGQGSHSGGRDDAVSRYMRGSGRNGQNQGGFELPKQQDEYEDFDAFLLGYAKSKGFGA